MSNIHQIADLHCDTAQRLLDGTSIDDPSLQVNLSKMREANFGFQIFACYCPPTVPSNKKLSYVNRMIDCVEREVLKFSDDLAICRSSEEITAARDSGRIAIMLAIENGDAIENDLANLELLYARGVRLMTIVHAKSHDWAISSNDPDPKFDGLSPFGCDIIAAMNDLRIIIDVSHAHDRTVNRVLKLSKKAIVASHSCCRAICDFERNLSDELIIEIARRGGIVGINFLPAFLDRPYFDLTLSVAGPLFDRLEECELEAGIDPRRVARVFPEFSKELRSLLGDTFLPAARIADHIDHIRNIAGVGAISFGGDLDGVLDLPKGIEDCLGHALILDELSHRGYSSQELKAIAWKNAMRVIEEK